MRQVVAVGESWSLLMLRCWKGFQGRDVMVMLLTSMTMVLLLGWPTR